MTSDPPGISCEIADGTTTGSTGCRESFSWQTSVTLRAAPREGSRFAGWAGACEGTGGCEVTATGDLSVTATFARESTPPNPTPTFALTVWGTGNGNGTVRADPAGSDGGIVCQISDGATPPQGCRDTYAAGAVVTLSAAPAGGSTFRGWSGGCTGTGACQVTLDEAREVTANFAVTTVAPEAVRGRWGATFGMPIVAVHASLVPHGSSGAVLVWGHAGTPYLWDLSNPTPTFAAVDNGIEMFCGGHTFLPDGTLLVTGGHDELKGNNYGIPDVSRFAGGAWAAAPPMHKGRWYPTATTLANGDVLTFAGTDNDAIPVRTPELWSNGTWRLLPGADRSLPYYPRSFVGPDGRVFYAGESNPSRWLDPYAAGGQGAWTAATATRLVDNRSYGSAAMYAPWKILYAGGGDPPTATAEVIDLNRPSPTWSATDPMAFPRRQFNLTILADGRVLATGGTSAPGFSTVAGGVRDAEVWDPTTGSWTTWAAESKVRVYHGTTILLPDGRVLSAGSGDSPGLPSETNGQIFTPPNLFDADGSITARPTIETVSATTIRYGDEFTVTTPDAAAIAKVHLIRFSAVTHSFNQSQTLYPASFTAGAGQLTVSGPPHGRIAPPGPYMLFLVDSRGVPSVAKLVTIRP